MKKLLLTAVALVALTTLAQAETVTINHTDHGDSAPLQATVHDHLDGHSVVGAKLDAPYLIGLKQLSPDLFIGVEGGKNMLNDLFHPDTRSYFEADKGYFGYVKVSYVGCLLNCPNK